MTVKDNALESIITRKTFLEEKTIYLKERQKKIYADIIKITVSNLEEEINFLNSLINK